MNAGFQYISEISETNLIHAFRVNVNDFGFHWHYHPELEITCIKQGRGTRLVGDHVAPFEAGDFVFMGSDLPHTWVSDDDFNRSEEQMEVAVLQFHPSLFSPQLLSLPEMRHIRHLLNYAGQGIEVKGARRAEAAQLLYQLIEAEGMQRFTLFLSLLNLLGQAQEFSLLVSKAYLPPLDHTTEERILKVCRYIHDNFTSSVKLETIARIANLNETSFCRFFKKSTGQSLSEYVHDLRIGKACNLLLDKRKYSMSEVAYLSGFNSQTLFNRIFNRKKGMTPSNFRKRFER